MISNMHFEGEKSVTSMKKATKKEKNNQIYEKNYIIIKIHIHIQHICLTGFAIRRMHKTYDATFYINTLNLKVNVLFPQNNFVSRPLHPKASFHIVSAR